MSQPIFLLGAGFNTDVQSEVILPQDLVEYNAYPLVNDIKRICGYSESNFSVEQMLANDIDRGNYEPLNKFCDQIMGCDHWLISELLKSHNCYQKFFNRFKESQFLTFNYDSLAECFLMKLGYWRPEEGYGISVKCERPIWWDRRIREYDCPIKGASKVLHLHGTFCLYTNDGSVYKFDPGGIQRLFPDYESYFSKHLDTLYTEIEVAKRIIAPIPNKAKEFSKPFIQKMYRLTVELIKKSGLLIVIGYSFNPHDRDSYQPLINALAMAQKPTLLLIAPDADRIFDNIKTYLKDLPIRTILKNLTFKQWAGEEMDGNT